LIEKERFSQIANVGFVGVESINVIGVVQIDFFRFSQRIYALKKNIKCLPILTDKTVCPICNMGKVENVFYKQQKNEKLFFINNIFSQICFFQTTF
jgi:hypothetical protein